MKKYIQEFENRLDKEWLREHIISLYRLERPQTSPAHLASAQYVYKLLESEGFETELVNIPSDGKTVYQDVRMPLGWDVEKMTLTLLTDVEGIDNKVIADYATNPCSAVSHSVSTPADGIKAKLITEDMMNAGEDVKDNFVLFNRSSRPKGKNIKEILDKGAIGFVSDYCENPGEAPDCTAWLNAATETASWYAQAQDRDFIAYLISENQGDLIRKACLKDDVWVSAYSDARRYETTLPFVSALLPGKSSKEIWVMAHMYEPLIDDNSNGVIGSIAILKAIRDMASEGMIDLKYSIRLVFASEVYGFIPAAEYYGGNLSERTIGGINMDGLPASVEKGKYRQWRVFEAPDIPVNAINILMHQIRDDAANLHSEYSFTTHASTLGDDQVLGDSTVGLPTAWFLRGGYNCFHHNSILAEDYLDVDVFADTLTLCGTWVCAMSSLSSDDILGLLPDSIKRANAHLADRAKDTIRRGTDVKKRMEYFYKREADRILALKIWADVPEIDSSAKSIELPQCNNTFADCDNTWFDRAEGYVFKRKTRGLPMDMTRIDNRDEQILRGLFIYYPIAKLLYYMDGKKNFKEIITEYEWSHNTIMDDSAIEKNLDICLTLAKYGYLEL